MKKKPFYLNLIIIKYMFDGFVSTDSLQIVSQCCMKAFIRVQDPLVRCGMGLNIKAEYIFCGQVCHYKKIKKSGKQGTEYSVSI